VATVPEQVPKINDFLSETVRLSDGFFAGFCSLHPDMTENEVGDEINRAISLGLIGVKLHPDIQTFEADSTRAFRIYEAVGDRLPILIHAGDSRYDYSSPKRIANALTAFPTLTMIAAHLGGWSEWEDSAACLAGKFGDRLYVDTSSSLYTLSPQKAVEYIHTFGEDLVIFGTDYPMWDVAEELTRFDKLDLSETTREKIFYCNYRKLTQKFNF
jgi:predicted TIM-barrel fold metal-dependent hydrolase